MSKSEKMPKVSVVIPAYNRARFLQECIESVLSQTFKDFEVLIVDDGSTDNTREVVSVYCPPVKYYHQDNQGAPATYNKGIELARGDYIAFLDSDDALLDCALQTGVDVLDRWPNVGLSYGQAYCVDEEGHVKGLVKPSHGEGSYIRSGKEEIKDFVLGNHITGSTMMVRRSCFAVVGLFNPMFRRGSEDFDMWVRLAKLYDVAYVDRPLVKYRVHSQSLSAGRQVDEVKWAHGLILRSIFNDEDLGHLDDSLRSKAYYCFYCRLARIAKSRGDFGTARGYLIKALKNYPQGMLHGDSANWLLLWSKAVLPPSFIDFARKGKRRLNSLLNTDSGWLRE
jgi:glycosyltransferase involved in cell wall biosynthesis